AVRQDVRGNPFVGQIQELSIMTPIAEHHISDDDQAPAVAKYLKCEVDGAARPLCVACAHKKLWAPRKPLAICLQFYYIGSACIMQADLPKRYYHVQASRP